MARARVEPDVENVAFALELRAAAGRAAQSLREKFLDRPFVPGVGVVALEDARRLLDDSGREHGLAARQTVERRDGHTPGALTRNAPVGPVVDHVEDAVVSPVR